MKKSKFIILLLTFCAILCSCNSNTSEVDTQDSTNVTELKIETTEVETTTEAEDMSLWIVNQFVDEFNQPTGEYFIKGVGLGTFNNSAANNSDLLAAIIMASQKLLCKSKSKQTKACLRCKHNLGFPLNCNTPAV